MEDRKQERTATGQNSLRLNEKEVMSVARYDGLQLVPISSYTKILVDDCMKSTTCWWLVTDWVVNRGGDVIHLRALWWNYWRPRWLTRSSEIGGRKRVGRTEVVWLMWNAKLMTHCAGVHSDIGFMCISTHSHLNQCAWSISQCQTVLAQAGWGSVLSHKLCSSAWGVRPSKALLLAFGLG